MNEIVNKLLLGGYRFMPEMHLIQPGFTFSACGKRKFAIYLSRRTR